MRRFMALLALMGVLGAGRIALADHTATDVAIPGTESAPRMTAFADRLSEAAEVPYWVSYRYAGGRWQIAGPFSLYDANTFANGVIRAGGVAFVTSRP
jgi:hypothetical protein